MDFAFAFFVLGAGASFVFYILLSLQNLHFHFIAGGSARMSDCGAVVVSDTPENFDWVEKEFGFTERGEERKEI